MFRVFDLILLLLILLLQIKLWEGQGSWPETQALHKQVNSQRAENARLKARNDALSAEVADLKSGESAIEERARSELGMVKPGETFYRVVEPAAPGSVVAPEDVPEDAAKPPPAQARAQATKK
jgi:cell division protein FtsB